MDAHENEYRAAVYGLADQTPSPAAEPAAAPDEPAVGDFISGTTHAKTWSGRVEWVKEEWACISVDGGWVYVRLADRTH